jgi:hypothetical protein
MPPAPPPALAPIFSHPVWVQQQPVSIHFKKVNHDY